MTSFPRPRERLYDRIVDVRVDQTRLTLVLWCPFAATKHAGLVLNFNHLTADVKRALCGANTGFMGGGPWWNTIRATATGRCAKIPFKHIVNELYNEQTLGDNTTTPLAACDVHCC